MLSTEVNLQYHNEIDTKVYKYKGIQRYTKVYKGIQRYTKVYKGIQGNSLFRVQASGTAEPPSGKASAAQLLVPKLVRIQLSRYSRRFDRMKTILSCLQFTPGWHPKLCQQKQDFAACPTTKE